MSLHLYLVLETCSNPCVHMKSIRYFKPLLAFLDSFALCAFCKRLQNCVLDKRERCCLQTSLNTGDFLFLTLPYLASPLPYLLLTCQPCTQSCNTCVRYNMGHSCVIYRGLRTPAVYFFSRQVPSALTWNAPLSSAATATSSTTSPGVTTEVTNGPARCFLLGPCFLCG